ncbi:MAG: aminopeptidase P family protein [Flavobacteriales bacterium]
MIKNKLILCFLFFIPSFALLFLFGKYNSQNKTTLSPSFHKNKRMALRDSMSENSVCLIFSYPVKTYSRDINYEYHQNPNLYYLTGVKAPHSMLMIFKDSVDLGGLKTNEILFLKSKTSNEQLWNARSIDIKTTKQKLGFQTIMLNKQFANLTFNFEKFKKIYHSSLPNNIENNMSDQGDLYNLINSFRSKTEDLQNKKNRSDLHFWLSALREVKSKNEIAILKKAINTTTKAHNALMKNVKPGMYEYEAEAIAEYIFKRNGCERPSFPSIIGSGKNACILHYQKNNDKINKQDMIVMDIGAQYKGYSADITRTIPANGKFNKQQKKLYEVIYKAQTKAIQLCKKGNKFWDPHNKAKNIIAKELKRLGIIEKKYEVNQFFMHGTSHYLGLDVHDLGTSNPLQPGIVITVEPGVYIPKGSNCDKKWWNIGIRIEDDILVTDDKPVVLSKQSPKKVEKIEEMMMKEGDFFDLK